MRRRGFSIEDIRKAFRHARPDEDIRLAFLAQPDDASMQAPPMAQEDSALDFVRDRQRLMEPVADYNAHSTQSPTQSPTPSSSGPIEQLLQQLRILSGQRRVANRTRAEPWVRFAATPDLEIHVRGQVPEDQEKLFEQIADHIRHILLGGDQHD